MKDYKSRISELMSEIKTLKDELRADVYKAINEVALANKREKISNHIFIVKHSELASSWEPRYYDWESSAEILIDKLNKKSELDLIPYLQSLYDNRNKNGVSIIKERVYEKMFSFTMYADVVHTINAEFIRQILEKLQ